MATHGNRRATVLAPVGFGLAELRPDPERPQGWELLVAGVIQSHVDLADPQYLKFGYARKIASVLRHALPPGEPMKVLHLGGGALSLPRFVAGTRPGSQQVVVERDAKLLALVEQTLPLPAGVKVLLGDAREVLEQQEQQAYDVIVADVYDGAMMPLSISGLGFAEVAARKLRPGGLLAMNVTDVPPLAYSRVQAATLRAAFADVALISPAKMMRGVKAGNVVLAAGNAPGDVPVPGLFSDALTDPEIARVLHGAELDEFAAGAKPRLDGPR